MPSGRPRVLVIGAGVSGLTSALCLSRRGCEVALLAERFAPHVTSVIAGALWEWPPAVCGHFTDPDALARSRRWAEVSLGRFVQLAADPATGVYLRPVAFYFRRPLAELPEAERKMRELAGKVTGFRHDPALIRENGVNPAQDYRDAYTHVAPMIDTDVYLRWLMQQVRDAGCRVVERRVAALSAALRTEFRADAVVNCTGLGAADLTGDPVFPVRGAVLRVVNDGRAMPRVTQAHCVAQQNGEPGFIFILPRGDDRLLLGGFAEPHQTEVNLTPENYEPIRAMQQRCVEFLPALAGARLDAAEPVRVGLRPFRRQNVRLETDAAGRIVHNYGHGGSGVTLSWGCALEAAERVADLLGRPAAD